MSDVPEQGVQLGAEWVDFTLRRSARRTLGITVFPDGAVLVAAPQDAPFAEIEARLRRRGAWLLKTRREFDSYRPHAVPRRFVSGETHRYLGRQLRLSLRPDARPGTRIEGLFLVVGGPSASDLQSTKRSVHRWYLSQAREVFAERLHHSLRHVFPEYRHTPDLTVLRLTQRWGSMSPDGQRLVLNTRLVEAPRTAIDYVIAHELCHVVHPHHGPEFFQLLEAKMPDWEKRKRQLERMMA